MTQTVEERKLNIFTVRQGLLQKRLFFDGRAGERGEAGFGALLGGLRPLGDGGIAAFVSAIRQKFAENGFHPAG